MDTSLLSVELLNFEDVYSKNSKFLGFMALAVHVTHRPNAPISKHLM